MDLFVLNPFWVTGFIDGEGTFHVGIQKNYTMALGKQVQLQFSITQHNRDCKLMHKFIDFFQVGNVTNDGKTKKQFRVRGLKDLEIIIEFVKKYPLLTQKKLDFEDFCLVHNKMKNNKHLTPEGFSEIEEIKSRMNRGRKFSI